MKIGDFYVNVKNVDTVHPGGSLAMGCFHEDQARSGCHIRFSGGTWERIPGMTAEEVAKQLGLDGSPRADLPLEEWREKLKAVQSKLTKPSRTIQEVLDQLDEALR